MTDKRTLESFVNIILLYILMLWDLVDLTLTEDISAFMPHTLPMSQKPQQYYFPLPLMPTKLIYDHSNGMNVRPLRNQENKSSASKNMFSLDGVLWHPYCAPEVERPKLDIVSTCLGGKFKYQPKSCTHLRKISYNQPIPDKNK